jgi:hypothetical protein
LQGPATGEKDCDDGKDGDGDGKVDCMDRDCEARDVPTVNLSRSQTALSGRRLTC